MPRFAEEVDAFPLAETRFGLVIFSAAQSPRYACLCTGMGMKNVR
jgi:hypothetical protein